MPIQFLSGNTYGPYAGSVPDTLTVDQGAIVHATTAGTAALTLGSGPWEDVVINGRLIADSGNGLNLKDAGGGISQISVGAVGEITANGASSAGIAFAHAAIIGNSGVIKAGHTGILETGNTDALISNTGLIEGQRFGVHFTSSGTHNFNNFGTISGGDYAILGESGIEKIGNVGVINGNIHLGDGNDEMTNFVEESGQRFDGKVVGVIDLGKGDDTFLGGKYADLVRDGDGKDSISLGAGDDVWFAFLAGGDDKDETIQGDSGNDTYDASQAGVVGVAINLDSVAHGGTAANSANDYNDATAGETIFSFEKAIGTIGADTIYGSSAANALTGLDGTDKLYGLYGNDVLKGDAGLDLLVGGYGKDTLYGGADKDIFDFNSIKESVRGSNRDYIADFERGLDDIDLRSIDAKKGGGNQAFKFIGTHKFHEVKGELHYKDLGSKCLVSGDVNGDGKADFEIMVHAGSLSKGDFLL